MPHINLQYSSNIKMTQAQSLLKQINLVLAQQLPTSLTTCKARSTKFDNYLIGECNFTNHGFIHLEVAIMSGRNPGLLKTISHNLLLLLQNNLANDNQNLKFDISVEIRNLNDNYAKREC